MKERRAELVQSLAPGLAGLAAELAQKIIHREVNRDSSLAMKQAEQAIAKLLKREKLIIRVNSADEESMKEHKPALQRMFDGIDKIGIISDPEVERGGCIVETDLIKVDAQPGSQLRAASRTILDGEEK
jgi:flagellar biosynthesis/type III secretory pathway protein FliH